jgi:hypothetical protein
MRRVSTVGAGLLVASERHGQRKSGIRISSPPTKWAETWRVYNLTDHRGLVPSADASAFQVKRRSATDRQASIGG